MNKHAPPEFFKAFDHYKAMIKQYGDDHPITEQALMLTMHYTPEHIKAEMHQKAKELNLLPPPSGYTDDGEPMYSLEDIAKHFGISEISAFDMSREQLLKNANIEIEGNKHNALYDAEVIRAIYELCNNAI